MVSAIQNKIMLNVVASVVLNLNVPGAEMKTMKRNRLRQLVQWEYITQPEANQLWRDYLRGVIPVMSSSHCGYCGKLFDICQFSCLSRK